jgi:hypothetical protein
LGLGGSPREAPGELARAIDLAETARDGFLELHDARRAADASLLLGELREASARPSLRRAVRSR